MSETVSVRGIPPANEQTRQLLSPIEQDTPLDPRHLRALAQQCTTAAVYCDSNSALEQTLTESSEAMIRAAAELKVLRREVKRLAKG